ncbi:polysaccharide pyruvyl transferase family protein [Microbacterium sp. NPDC057650]|uniref:polysaccharide pyruvyl transferase family protein n=1 Tax=unclassified Microbacterium TaxID=2609290 RepID=UPI0036715703
MSETSRWLVLSSGNGSTNLGDEAMWVAAAQTVREFSPVAEIITDASRTWRSPLHGVSAHPFFHGALRRGAIIDPLIRQRYPLLDSAVSFPAKERRASKQALRIREGRSRAHLVEFWTEQIRQANGLIFSGAGAITQDYSVHGIYGWATLTALARQASTPVAFIGQGIGPDLRKKHEPYVRTMLEAAELVTVREQRSAAAVRGLAPDAPDPLVTYDWALAIEPTAEDRSHAERIVRDLTNGRPFYAVSFHRRSEFARGSLQRLAHVADEIVRAAQARNAEVVFVSNMTAGRYSDDRVTADKIGSRMQHATDLKVVRQRLTPGTTRALLGLSRGTIATRYHPLVFALSEGTPVWGLSSDAYYDQKLSGISDAFDVRQNVSRITDTSISGEEILRRLVDQIPKKIEDDVLMSIKRPLIDFLARHS